jgi:hypothetical protein
MELSEIVAILISQLGASISIARWGQFKYLNPIKNGLDLY